MKKTFIKVKRGLLTAEHVDRLGPRWALYLYMIDTANWETGEIEHWTDFSAGEELGRPETTIRQQRQQLERDGYVRCTRGFQESKIAILKWMDPRLPWEPKEVPHTDNVQDLNFDHSDNHSDNHSDKPQSAPSYIAETRFQIKDGAQTKKMMDHIDEYPPELQGVVQDICEVWGHRPPTKKSQYFSMWIKGARELLEACGEFPVKDVISAIRDRWEADGGGISITSPMSLVSLARDDAARRRSGPLNVREHGQKDLARQGMTDKQKLAGLMDGTWRGNE